MPKTDNNQNTRRSDEELMSLYQSGDFTAFQTLYQRHSGRVCEYLKKRCPSNELAMDLAQETFERLHKSRSKYSVQYPFLPWLFTISRNTLIDHFKLSENRLTAATQDLETSVSVAPLVDLQIDTPDISPALATLPLNQKQAIELRYLREWSFGQIATHMDTSEDNARKLISRGMKQIRKFFGNGGKQ